MLQLRELPAIPSSHHTVQPKGELRTTAGGIGARPFREGGSGSGGQQSGARPAGTRRSSRCHVTQARGSRRESPSYRFLLQPGPADSKPSASPNSGTKHTQFNSCTKRRRGGAVRPPRREGESGETSEVANRESAAAGAAPNPGLPRTPAAQGPGAARAGEGRDGGAEG